MQYAITGSLFLILLAGAATAQGRIAEQDGLGIELDELLTERGTIRLEFGTTISASSSDGISGLYQTIQTGTGEYVSVPIDLGVTDRQADTVLGTFGLSYGLTSRAEIYAWATMRYDDVRFTDTTTELTESLSSSAFQSLITGMSYSFIEEGEYPGLIGFAEFALLENTTARGTDFETGRSGAVGVTAYRVLDPVVLSLTTGYAANLERTVGADILDPGDNIFFNPSIGFAVNNELTLTGGFNLNYATDADELNSNRQGSRSTTADLQFGLAYAWDETTTLQADTSIQTLGGDNFILGLSLTRELGKE
jgi:hypothetical protein